MLGIAPFSGLPFSSLPDIAEVVDGEAVILATADLSALGGYPQKGTTNIYAIADLEAEGIDQNGGKASITARAILLAKANHKVVGVAMIEGVATLVGSSEIAGEGWVRINPDTDEWDYKQSSDWNKIN
jgi:hypothetical protein